MKQFRNVIVKSETFEHDLKTLFPIMRSRKNWCHWYFIRAFSQVAYQYHVETRKDGDWFNYLGDDYKITYADNHTSESIREVKSVGVSMRVFTNAKKETYYIAVVTEWRGDIKQ